MINTGLKNITNVSSDGTNDLLETNLLYFLRSGRKPV